MISRIICALVAAAIAAAPVHARALKIIEPIAAGVVGANQVTAIDVTISATAAPIVATLDAKAAEKRAAAKLAAFDPASVAAERPAAEVYETLPLAASMPLVVQDVTRDWGLIGGRPIKLAITVDTLKTADAGMALLLGSTDQLAGLVMVKDATTDEKLGEFYVDVLNARAGLLGLALRGSGVREKLGAEFGKRVAQALSGAKDKPKSTKA